MFITPMHCMKFVGDTVYSKGLSSAYDLGEFFEVHSTISSTISLQLFDIGPYGLKFFT